MQKHSRGSRAASVKMLNVSFHSAVHEPAWTLQSDIVEAEHGGCWALAQQEKEINL